jgi:hypothetical protein
MRKMLSLLFLGLLIVICSCQSFVNIPIKPYEEVWATSVCIEGDKVILNGEINGKIFLSQPARTFDLSPLTEMQEFNFIRKFSVVGGDEKDNTAKYIVKSESQEHTNYPYFSSTQISCWDKCTHWYIDQLIVRIEMYTHAKVIDKTDIFNKWRQNKINKFAIILQVDKGKIPVVKNNGPYNPTRERKMRRSR